MMKENFNVDRVNAEQIEIRPARREDYPRILTLENSNYVDNLTDLQRKDGFLSARMSEPQVAMIANDLGITVAYEGDAFLGFFCVSRREHWPINSIVHRLVSCLKTDFRDSRVDDPRAYCVFGPMCLSTEARGKGVLKKLYEHANANLPGQLTAAAGFISVDNPRSLGAMAKLDWRPVGRFKWGEREYHALIRDID
jgi:hypothetical protein